MSEFILNRPLYTDKDKKLVLEEGDSRAAFVIGGKGTPIDEADVEKYGLDDSHRLKEEEKETIEARPLTTADIAVASNEENEGGTVVKKDEDGSAGSDLESLSVVDLKEKAKEMGLTGYSGLNKADLIAAIQAGPQEGEE